MEKNNGDNFSKLFAVYWAQDDPKKNTIVHLFRQGIVTQMDKYHRLPRESIILDPFSKEDITIGDRKTILDHGIVVIDCSWKYIDKVIAHTYNMGKRSKCIYRRLPLLIAANTINYGRWGKLSSAEALAAALWIVNEKETAIKLLDYFPWGTSFWEINFKAGRLTQ